MCLTVGVPLSAPWLKFTPDGRAPDSVMVGAGVPVAVTLKLLALPSVKVALSPEVINGGPSTVRVKDWVASGLTPLDASMVKA